MRNLRALINVKGAIPVEALHLAAEMARLPPVRSAVGLLDRLAAERQPIAGPLSA